MAIILFVNSFLISLLIRTHKIKNFINNGEETIKINRTEVWKTYSG